jgi:hypothetical protein
MDIIMDLLSYNLLIVTPYRYHEEHLFYINSNIRN